MKSNKFRLAVATDGKKKIEDTVSQVFGRAGTFTILDIENRKIKGTIVIDNPATSYKHGVGPIVVQELTKLKVNVVVAPEFGPGASALLEQKKIRMIPIKPDTNVKMAVEEALKTIQ